LLGFSLRVNVDVDVLSDEAIAANLTTRLLGRAGIHYLALADSTNEVARRLADAGAPEGTLVIAEEQTAGRGRLGRRWLAPSGTSLLFSLLLRPNLPAGQAMRLTMLAGLGAAEGIQAATGLVVRLKWPNDILVAGRKVGGVLIEAGLSGDRLDYAVAGIGINVNFRPAEVAGIPPTAGSLAEALNRPVARLPLLVAVLAALDARYLALQAGQSPRADWVARLDNLGQTVDVLTPNGVESGLAEAVDDDGALLVRRADGSQVHILAGDVSLRPV
jgi:BirA family biotin operon repressor/biotin-[acetyl-CoA-carboxylase] ligase